MKQMMTAAVALALGLGVTAAAQAHGTLRQSAMPQHHTRVAAARVHAAQLGPTMNRQQIAQAQQQLKADGLYNGPIDGRDGRKTRLALTRFQQQNGLPHTARLDSATLSRLTGNQTVGVGSSTPNQMNQPNGGNGINPTPIMPPATQAPGAGDNGGNSTTISSPPNTPH